MTILGEYLNREEMATELNVTTRTLIRWERQPNGIPYTKLGHRTLYRRKSVLDWIDSQERHPNPRR